MRLAAIGASDVGRKRAHNEDAFLVMPEAGLFCVADGLGGHASGEVASRMAVESLAASFSGAEADVPGGRPDERLAAAVRRANREIHARARAGVAPAGMGTTLVAAFFAEGGPLFVAHAGDSRAYLFRESELRRLTDDHSLLQDFIRRSNPSPAEVQAFPHKNVVVRALGMRPEVEVELSQVEVRVGDVVLLCCDGIHGMVTDEHMAGILRAGGPDLQRANQALLDAAMAAGGGDNATSVLVQVTEL
jgi:PPM family protein phosphatase